jgi:hypothetical protein
MKLKQLLQEADELKNINTNQLDPDSLSKLLDKLDKLLEQGEQSLNNEIIKTEENERNNS